MKYLIVGNSAAAIGAVEGIRRVDAAGEITLLAAEPYHTYSRPLISYYLSGKVTPEKMYYRDLNFYDRMRVRARLGETAKAVDPENAVVILESGEAVPYDKLLIATGGKPVCPPIPGRELEEVFFFHKWDDVKALEKALFPGAKVVVIGAGLIGLKATEALVKKQAEVRVVELSNRVLSAILDEEAASIVQRAFEHHGVSFHLNTTVAEICGQGGKVSGVRLTDGSEWQCDLVIIAIGVSPNTDIVQSTAIKVNRGIVVDAHLATSCTGIYAAGDVAEGYDKISGELRVIPILPNAYKQGYTAGMNMAGETVSYPGGFAMNSIGFFDLPMITAGLAKAEGREFTTLVHADHSHDCYKKVILRDGRIVGFILLNRIDRAGILTGLLEREVDVTPYQSDLLRDDFGYVYFPRDYRRQLLYKGGMRHGCT